MAVFKSFAVLVLSHFFFNVESRTEVVRNVQCYVYSSTNTRCSWEVAIPEAEITFFYRLWNENGRRSLNDKAPPYEECGSYSYTDSLRTGCDVRTNVQETIETEINGKVNGTSFNKTGIIKKNLWLDVRPPPLKWTVKKTGNEFDISWTLPEITNGFKEYLITYTECKETQEEVIGNIETTSIKLEIVPHCQYRMTIKAVHENFSTPPSEEKYFDAEMGQDALVLAAVIIPLIFVVLAFVTCIYCKKNQELFFPKIPIPRDLLTGISDTHKSAVSKTYIVEAEAEENCNIVLVMDSQAKMSHVSNPKL